MPFLVADIGTSTLKVAVVDEDSNFLFFLSEEVPLLRPEPDAAEHDPERLFELFLTLSQKAISKTGVEIEGIVFSGYLFGLVALDKEGRPLTGLMTWLDRRPVEILDELYSKVGPSTLYEMSGCPPLYIYQLPKLYWLARRRPEIYVKTTHFLDAKGYLIYRLTGRLLFEKSSASGSQLLNMKKLEWNDELLNELGLDPSKLPELVEPDEVIGEVDKEIASHLGLKRPVPVIPGIFDGGSVAVGEGALSEGVGSSHLSTSTMIRVASRSPVIDKSGYMRFQTYYAFRGTWLPGGALNNAGIVLRWFRDNLGLAERIIAEELGVNIYDILNQEAGKAPPGSDGLIFLPFISGERIPEFGNNASGVLYGLRENHTRSHVIRSFMEGVAFNLRSVKEALEENSLKIVELRVTGGGAKSDLWLQIISDVLEVPVKRVSSIDASLLGATILGMKAVGKIRDIQKLAMEKSEISKTFMPSEGDAEVYRKNYSLYRMILKQIKIIFSTDTNFYLP